MAEPVWNEILEYLKPKQPLYIPENEKPSQKQRAFLRTNALEALYGGAAGGGKLVDISLTVPTPFGFKKMADIRPGDFVFGRDGLPHLVEAESEVVRLPAWKLTFDDGAEVIAHDEHLWLTFNARELEALTRRSDEFRERRRGRRESRVGGNRSHSQSVAIIERNKKYTPPTKPAPTGTVRTTKEIVETLTVQNGRRNHAIPVASPLQLPHRDLPLDPYLLGVWLGDGTRTAGEITSMDPEIIQAFLDAGYVNSSTRGKVNSQAKTYRFTGLVADLRKAGVFGDKHVPHEYLWASEEQRLALLQGLMDTDGNVAKASVEFCNTNRSLAEAVAHLARSLGMKVTVREGRAKFNGEDYGPVWKVKFAANRVVFRLPRKAQAQSIASRRTNKFRYIVSAERTEPVEMKCIRVSSPDHLYLIGEHFIPTHNSSALLMAALQYVDVPGYSAILFRKTYADLALPSALMDRFLEWIKPYRGDEIHWNPNTYTATFPSGARITFGYLNNTEDYLRYKGAEFQFVGMDEVTEIRENDYKYLFSRLRKPTSGPLSKVPLRMRCASNPAPNWVRQRFIVEGKQFGRVFVPATLYDNPGIDHASYRKALAELDPVERKRLEEGDWWVTQAGSLFNREDFIIIGPEEIPITVGRNAKVVRFWDLAATEQKGNNDPDWTVGTLMLFADGIAYVLDVKRFRGNPDEVERKIAFTASEDGPNVPIRMEQEPGSSGKSLIDQYARYVLPGFDFMGIRSSGDKVLRANPLAAAVANGNVRLVRGPWLSTWLDELTSFPEAVEHDDQVDSATGAFNFLTGLGGPGRKRAALIV